MILGILGHVVRFGIYSIGTPETLWLVILSNVVHGFAYAFFFATVYIFVDENFPKDVRTSAQSLFNLLILGLGPLASNFLSAALGDAFLPEGGAQPGGDPDGLSQALPGPARLWVPGRRSILAIFFHPEGQGPGTRGGPRPGKLKSRRIDRASGQWSGRRRWFGASWSSRWPRSAQQPAPMSDAELSQHLTTVRAQIANPTLDLGRREELAQDMAAHARSGGAVGGRPRGAPAAAGPRRSICSTGSSRDNPDLPAWSVSSGSRRRSSAGRRRRPGSRRRRSSRRTRRTASGRSPCSTTRSSGCDRSRRSATGRPWATTCGSAWPRRWPTGPSSSRPARTAAVAARPRRWTCSSSPRPSWAWRATGTCSRPTCCSAPGKSGRGRPRARRGRQGQARASGSRGPRGPDPAADRPEAVRRGDPGRRAPRTSTRRSRGCGGSGSAWPSSPGRRRATSGGESRRTCSARSAS